MFSAITRELCDIVNSDSDDAFLEATAFLYQLPLWKFFGYYLYTFTYRSWQEGKSYRSCLKWVLLPYKIRWCAFKARARSWFIL